MERTLVIIKPDGVKRGLIGEIISRYERKGFKILDAKLIRADRKILEQHYAEHKGKDFFEKLVAYMMEGPVMVMIIEGEDAIEIIRNMNGHKDPKKALPGTIRGDYANSVTKNIVHASDSIEAAIREINIWFK
ncbi:nucleoside diphosphate kinase [Caloranaerobacter sp. TR13]|uniref:nucleoside-diphosphate kinase n=1 Tax=Caloranaerobacter sp. TR13 TaxID=1302151 RepID=UPI0006D4236C|nr:nucleoside-diphosphate kinase [Caloranaerobacter sp. TR13]KPU27714.1 nucleoside diphosphate kinase [Caloranaerobacter sp. TR13]